MYYSNEWLIMKQNLPGVVNSTYAFLTRECLLYIAAYSMKSSWSAMVSQGTYGLKAEVFVRIQYHS